MKTLTASTESEKETPQNLKLNELNDRLKRMVQSTRSLATCSSFDQVIHQLLQELAQNVGSRGGSIYLVKDGSLVLQRTLDPGHAEPVISLPPPAASVFGRAITQKMPILVQNIATEKDTNPCGWTGYHDGSLLAFPFFDNQEQLIGVFSLHNKACPPFTLQDMEIGSILAAHSCEIIKAGLSMEALAQSEAKYRDLTENIKDVSLFTLDTMGIVTYISPSVQSVTGYHQVDFLGKDYRNNFLAEEGVRLTDSFIRNSPDQVSSGIFGLKTPGGELRWIRISSWPIWEKDCFVGSQGTLTDMTEIKTVQEKLEKNIQEMATLSSLGREMVRNLSVDHIVDVAISHIAKAIQPDSIMFFVTEGNRLVLRKSMPEKMPGDELLVPELRLGKCLCGLAAVKHQTLYFANIHIDPRCIFDECKLAGLYSMAALPMINANEVVGIIAIASKTERDFEGQSAFLEAISHEIAFGLNNALLYEKAHADAIELQTRLLHIQAVEVEKERLMVQLQHAQKMEAIGTLAGGIAHDFNNILTPIIMGTEMAQRYIGADSPASAMIEKTLCAAGRARDLVQHILTFSRKSDIHINPLRIKPIIREIIKMARSILPATIEIKQDLKSENDLVLANPAQIHQVVMNLITNAAHAMRISGGELSISLKNQFVNVSEAFKVKGIQPGNYVCLIVRDTGHGMDQKTLEQIFDPFFTTKERGEGTGLGLSIIHGIVKSGGGMIEVDSKIGKGTVFTVLLPVINQPLEEKSNERLSIPTGHERILLIDDEPFIVEVVSAMLQDIGYRVDGRNDSNDALNVFSLHPDNYDLIITDMTMPRMTGDRLAMKILQIRSDIPIIMCTGFSEHMTPEKAEEIGIKALLMKPVAIGELATAIRNVIR